MLNDERVPALASSKMLATQSLKHYHASKDGGSQTPGFWDRMGGVHEQCGNVWGGSSEKETERKWNPDTLILRSVTENSLSWHQALGNDSRERQGHPLEGLWVKGKRKMLLNFTCTTFGTLQNYDLRYGQQTDTGKGPSSTSSMVTGSLMGIIFKDYKIKPFGHQEQKPMHFYVLKP